MSNKELIRKAFDDVCVAMVELEGVKSKLAELHYKAELVENTQSVLDRVSLVFEPSNDSHEAVFIQHERAKVALRDALSVQSKASIESGLGMAHNATSEAYSLIQRV
jgi:hypothetical protein